MVIPVDEIITPKTIVKIDNEGMPIFISRKEDDHLVKRGHLYVKFDIKFPKTLNESQRKRIEQILAIEN